MNIQIQLKKFDLISENFVLDKNSVQRRQVDKKHAFINVSYGCDNFCSYCVVPYSRGCEISRAEKEIIDEIKCLVEKGISEITLCGQNVNSWGLSVEDKMKIRLGSSSNGLGKKTPFAVLVEKVHKISGIEKIDFIWYLKKIGWLALIGYAAGAITYILQHQLLGL